MKKFRFIVIPLLMVMFLATTVQAGGFWKGLFVKDGPVKKASPNEPAIKTILGSESPLPINLNGDTLFLIQEKTFTGATSMDLATYKNIIYLKAVASTDALGYAGFGLGGNIPSLLNLIPGVNWNASFINPSLSFTGGYKFSKSKADYGPLLTIVNLTFD